MNWFEEWFESSLYEKLYANRDEPEAKQLIHLLEQTLSLKKYQKILDLACGRGRHSLNLAEKGYNVTGIDLSRQAIKTAKEKAEKRNLKNVHFYVHDMRDSLNAQFDAVINLFTSFGYFLDDKENVRVLENISEMLKPSGVFGIDYLNAHKVRKSFTKSESGSFQGIDYNIKRYVKNEAIYKEIKFQKDSHEKTYSERVKLYDADWFKQQLGKYNLIIDEIYGDYHGQMFNPNKSDRLLMIGRKEK